MDPENRKHGGNRTVNTQDTSEAGPKMRTVLWDPEFSVLWENIWEKTMVTLFLKSLRVWRGDLEVW